VEGLGRTLVGLGALLLLLGAVLVVAGRLGAPLGRLPGDFAWRGRNVQVFFPLGTSLLVSVLLSLVFYLLSRFHR
jgi:uncharacterized membrane protein